MQQRWRDLWQRLGATDSLTITGFFSVIEDAYAGKQRFYHNTDHLQDVLAKLDLAKTLLEKTGEFAAMSPDEKTHMFDTIELALWYHDAVYDPRAKDNEAKSRDMLLMHANILGIDMDLAKSAAHLVDMTASHRSARTLVECILVDCDLAILGADARTFAKYDRDIRQEYAFVPEDIYTVKRREVLMGFLDQDEIFKTRAFRSAFEAAARKNLTEATAPPPALQHHPHL